MEFFVMIAVVGAILWAIGHSQLKPQQPKLFSGQIRGWLK